MSNITMEKRIHCKIQELCNENGVTDFESKFKNALICYKNATYYGILTLDLIDRFIEIGFHHPILGESFPLKGKVHNELVDYCPNEILQIDFLETEFNAENDEVQNS